MCYALGADIGGTRTKLGLVELNTGQVLESMVLATEKEEERFLSCMLTGVQKITEKISGKKIIGAGAAISGYVHHQSGTIDMSSGSFIPFFPGYPIRDKLEELLKIPCEVENDATAACYGEALYGIGKNYERVLMLTLGTGIGVGFTAYKKISWANALMHRAGHIKVGSGTERNKECYCGIDGCLEGMCSGTALEDKGREEYGRVITAEELFARGKEDLKAKRIIEEYIGNLCTGLNQYIYLYAPDVIVLGGGVAKGLERYAEELTSRLTAKVHANYQVDIRFSELKEKAGILGSAALFL